MTSDFNALKKKVLEEQYQFYSKQYEAVCKQMLGDVNQANKVAHEEQLTQIGAKIESLEHDLTRLKCANSSPQERHNTVSQHLHKIDFTQARKTFQAHLSRIGTGCDAALFLLPESLRCCGELCVTWITEYLKHDQTGEFKSCPVRFAAHNRPDEFGVFESIGKYLNEPRNDDDCVEYARRLRRRLYNSVRSTTVVLFEFPNWEALARDDQTRVFQRFHEIFWRPLTQELPAAMRERKQVNVKCVAVFLMGGKFAVPLECSGEQVCALSLQKKWTKQDISDWLTRFGGQLDGDAVAHWTDTIFQNSENGKPSLVRDAIKQQFG